MMYCFIQNADQQNMRQSFKTGLQGSLCDNCKDPVRNIQIIQRKPFLQNCRQLLVECTHLLSCESSSSNGRIGAHSPPNELNNLRWITAADHSLPPWFVSVMGVNIEWKRLHIPKFGIIQENCPPGNSEIAQLHLRLLGVKSIATSHGFCFRIVLYDEFFGCFYHIPREGKIIKMADYKLAVRFQQSFNLLEWASNHHACQAYLRDGFARVKPMPTLTCCHNVIRIGRQLGVFLMELIWAQLVKSSYCRSNVIIYGFQNLRGMIE